MRRASIIFMLMIMLTACGIGPQEQVGAVIPSRIPPTGGPSPTPLPTATPQPSSTPLPSPTAQPSPTAMPSAETVAFTIRVTWPTTDNIDLGVTEPGNTLVSAMRPESDSGGRLIDDVNANCDTATEGGTESIVWPAGTALEGPYTVIVSYQIACRDDASPVPVEVDVMLGDEVLLQEASALLLGGALSLSFDFDLNTTTNPQVVLTRPTMGQQPITYGQSVTNTIADDQYEFNYTFDGLRDDVITLAAYQIDGDLDVSLRLLDDAGNVVAFNEDLQDGVVTTDAGLIGIILPQDGVYTVVVSRFQGEAGTTTGRFELNIELLLRGSELFTVGGPLAYGASARGLLNDDRPEMRYDFFGSANDVVMIEAWTFTEGISPWIDLSGPDGRIYAAGVGMLEPVLLPAIGPYTITITHTMGDNAPLPYEINLTMISTNPEDASLTNRVFHPGDVIADVLFEGAYEHQYMMLGQQGQVVEVIAAAEDAHMPLFVALFNDEGRVLTEAANTPGAFETIIHPLAIPYSGIFQIAVFPDVPEGSELPPEIPFRLEFREHDAPGQMTLGYGDSIGGEINNFFPHKEILFAGEQGDIITLAVNRIEGDLDTYLLLFDAEGHLLADNDDIEGTSDSAIAAFQLPYSGEYVVVVTRFQEELGSSSGVFELHLILEEQAAFSETSMVIPLDPDFSGSVGDMGAVHHTLFPGDDVRNANYQAFITFPVPEDWFDLEIIHAALLMDCEVHGEPFAEVGPLYLVETRYERLDAELFQPEFGTPIIAELGGCPMAPIDITPYVHMQLEAEQDVIQLQMAFADVSADNSVDDVALLDPHLEIIWVE